MGAKRTNPIKAWRQSLGLKQFELAKRVGVSQMAVSNAERCRPMRRATIDKFLAAAAGALAREDFREQAPRRKRKNG